MFSQNTSSEQDIHNDSIAAIVTAAGLDAKPVTIVRLVALLCNNSNSVRKCVKCCNS